MSNKPAFPRDEDNWEHFKDTIVSLYIGRNMKLANVIDFMIENHNFGASEKQYKTHFRNWAIGKNFKADEAALIANGKLPGSARVRHGNIEDLQRRAKKSVKRSQARQKEKDGSQQLVKSTQPSQALNLIAPSRSPVLIVAPHKPTFGHVGGPSVVTPSIKSFELLFHELRFYTHEACVERRHWDPESSQKNVIGRKALRELSLDLTAGAKYFEEGKAPRAERLWSRALKRASKRNLLDTWYYETPIALLFELGRLVHKGHQDVAYRLIQTVTRYAKEYLDERDSRRKLFAAFEALEIPQLKDGYSSAALSLQGGLATRLEKHNPLLYQFGLHRALDLVWFDPAANLKKWVVPVEEIDQNLGPDTPLSVYFLLLDAYRQVAQGSYSEAERICSQVSRRLAVLRQNGQLDELKIGMAYRRLGRQYYEMKQWDEARLILNQALRFIGPSKHSVLVEIYHLQIDAAAQVNDTIDVEFWKTKLQQIETDLANQAPDDIPSFTKSESIDETLTPMTRFGSMDEVRMSDMWPSIDDYSSFGTNNFPQPMMMQQSNFMNYNPVGFTAFSGAMNAPNAPPMFLSHESSVVRFTEDPEPFCDATYGNQPSYQTMNQTTAPALPSLNTSLVTPSGMVPGSLFELQDDQSTSPFLWDPGRNGPM